MVQKSSSLEVAHVEVRYLDQRSHWRADLLGSGSARGNRPHHAHRKGLAVAHSQSSARHLCRPDVGESWGLDIRGPQLLPDCS
jgi:hypothetical protein